MYEVDTELKASGPALGFAVGHKDALKTDLWGGREGALAMGWGRNKPMGSMKVSVSQQRLRGHFPFPFSKGKMAYVSWEYCLRHKLKMDHEFTRYRVWAPEKCSVTVHGELA